jgi:hypothetical protein
MGAIIEGNEDVNGGRAAFVVVGDDYVRRSKERSEVVALGCIRRKKWGFLMGFLDRKEKIEMRQVGFRFIKRRGWVGQWKKRE